MSFGPTERAIVLALAAAVLLTPVVGRLARAIGFVAAPRGDRLHQTPTPYLGGLAILLALLVGLALSGNLELRPAAQPGELPGLATLLVLLAIGSFVLGLADDVFHLAPPLKLAGQVVLGMFFLASGGDGPLSRPEWNGILGFFWIVGLMNACNFLDNMDGVLAGVGLLCALTLFLLATRVGAGALASGWLPALIGALGGFLLFNRPKASIFMGDAGSLMVGLTLATAAWAIASAGGRLSHWLALPLALAYPLFDIAFVTITRISRRQPPWVGGRDHTNHRLLTRLGGAWPALGAVYGLQAVGGGAALVAASMPVTAAIVILCGVATLFTGVGLWLRTVPVR